MTPPNPLIELAERCEKLTGPCRETDILIGYAVDLKGDDQRLTFRRSLDVCGMEQMLRMGESHQNIWRHELPRYTASLNAAMTLLPPNHRWLMNGPDVDGAGHDIKPCASVLPYGESLTHPQDSHEAATPVLAFLSANLRARAASESPHG